MRRVLIATGLLLAGCDYIDSLRTDPAIRACEVVLRATIKVPGSYRRDDSSIAGDAATLEFEAANSFGTMIRDVAICRFWQDKSHLTAAEISHGDQPGYTIRAMSIGADKLTTAEIAIWSAKLYNAGLYAIPAEKTALRETP